MPVLSLSDFLWSLLIIFFMVTYFMMLFHVIVDIFRRKDTSGFTKAIWLLFLLIFPLVGLLAYLIVNGQGMGARDVGAAQESKAQFDDYVRSVSEARRPRSSRPSGCSTAAPSTRASSTA